MMNCRIVRDGLEELHRLDLQRCESRHLRVTLRVADVPADVERAGRPVRIAVDGKCEERIVAVRLFVVSVPVERLVQHLDQIRSAAEHLVVDGGRARDPALTSGHCSLQAQQADEVGTVGVKVLSCSRPIEANARIVALTPSSRTWPSSGAVRVLADRAYRAGARDRGTRSRPRRDRDDRWGSGATGGSPRRLEELRPLDRSRRERRQREVVDAQVVDRSYPPRSPVRAATTISSRSSSVSSIVHSPGPPKSDGTRSLGDR